MQQTSEPDKLRSLLRCNSKLSRSGAKKLRSLLHCNKQASEPDKLRSLLRCSSKLSHSRACCCNAASSHAPEPKSSEAYCVVASSRAGQAPKFAALQQQALTLWSLLLQRSKLSCFGACCVAASKLRSRTSSGICCVAATSSHAPELAATMQQALTLRSLLLQCSKLRSRTSFGAWCVAGFSCSKQAPKPRSSGEALELGACLPLQTKQTKIK